MTLTTETVPGAAYWASYLINGDDSGLEGNERALCDQWLERLGYGAPVDVGEPYYSNAYGFHTGAPFIGGDLADYTFLVESDA